MGLSTDLHWSSSLFTLYQISVSLICIQKEANLLHQLRQRINEQRSPKQVSYPSFYGSSHDFCWTWAILSWFSNATQASCRIDRTGLITGAP
ncbi:uncharacterized protein LOC131311850 isoform X2 [Rhododendron vialii]|uniref:uncharacterized protein LOC131311850 isoform X2 n=1 Tax=Rhododendron vialii TaxID=182163 RepID=UPI00266050BA|nr:uncharacterized protein LOC131311850 isoform X2 [Rhododendron vialii]